MIQGVVLILGARGMLGAALTRVFLRYGAEVRAWDREDCDITNRDELEHEVAEINPSFILNTAAYNAVDLAEARSGWDIARRVNGNAVGYLADIARKHRTCLVHYSTDYVFDGEHRGGYDEHSVPHPRNFYGLSKHLGELKMARAGMPGYLIRTSRLFGSKGIGQNSKESFVDLMIRMIRAQDAVRVVRGEEISSPTYVDDLAVATLEIVSRRLPYGIYHRTNDGACDWYDFAQETFRVTGVSPKLIPISSSQLARAAKRPTFSVLLSTKLPALRKWQDALKEYLTSEEPNIKAKSQSII